MIRVEGQSATREELEAKFLAQHASFAKSWSLARDQRVTTWTSPGQTLRVLVELIPFEYVEKNCVAGMIGEALTWDEMLLKRAGDAWVPTTVSVTPLTVKPKKTAKLVKKARHVS
jgi:hypothetical protein